MLRNRTARPLSRIDDSRDFGEKKDLHVCECWEFKSNEKTKVLSWKICLVYPEDYGREYLWSSFKTMRIWYSSGCVNRIWSCFNKWSFFKKVVESWHIVSDKRNAVDDEKTKGWLTQNKHHLRSTLKLCTYYRRFALGFTNIFNPLIKLPKEESTFVWHLECQAAY